MDFKNEVKLIRSYENNSSEVIKELEEAFQEGFKLVCATSLVSAPGYSFIEYVLTRIVPVKEE